MYLFIYLFGAFLGGGVSGVCACFLFGTLLPGLGRRRGRELVFLNFWKACNKCRIRNVIIEAYSICSFCKSCCYWIWVCQNSSTRKVKCHKRHLGLIHWARHQLVPFAETTMFLSGNNWEHPKQLKTLPRSNNWLAYKLALE